MVEKKKKKLDDAQLSGDWQPVEGQEADAALPKMPPAALRKKKNQPVEVPKISLEDRLAGENITARAFQEEEGFQLQRLKDKTTGGAYHLYLIVYLACILAAFISQRILPEDLLHATSTAGHSIAQATNRIMLPNALSTFSTGLRYYEDEGTRALNKRPPGPLNGVLSGWDAAAKVSAGDMPTSISKSRRPWFQLPTGFILGFPAATLYTVHQIWNSDTNNKSALELLLTFTMYISLIALGMMGYFRVRRQFPLMPAAMAPVAVIVFASAAAVVVSSVMTFSESICKQPMPDTIQLFTSISIIVISCIAGRMAFFPPKSKARQIEDE